MSAEDIDNNIVSIEDNSLSDISYVDNDLSSSNIESQVDLNSIDSDSDSVSDSDSDLDSDDDLIQDGSIKANLKATKLNTTYKSGKYFIFKAVDSDDNRPVHYAYLKLRVYTGEKYKDYYPIEVKK